MSIRAQSVPLVLASNTNIPPQALRVGARVFVRIISSPVSGAQGFSARVSINGHTTSAQVPTNLKQGDTLTMRVQSIASAVVLVPEEGSATQSMKGLFSQLGIPPGPVSESIVALFQSLNIKIQPEQVIRLSNLAKHFRSNEEKAALIAGILEEKGVPVSEGRIGDILDALHGDQQQNSADTMPHDEDSDELLQFINHRHSADGHWLLVPFEKQLGEVLWIGFAAFLLDIRQEQVRYYTIHAHAANLEWIFLLTEKSCVFQRKPAPTASEQVFFTEKLTAAFTVAQMKMSVRYGEARLEPVSEGIDISV